MKIGLILECQDGGVPHRMSADEIVCRHVISVVAPQVDIEIIYLNNKPRLMDECGVSAKLLLDMSACDCVLIVWDLYPPWGGQVCMKRDRDKVFEKLADAGIAQAAPVYLVCISYELETWFVAERGVLIDTGLKSKQGNKVRRIKDFETKDPKTVLSEYFHPHYSATTAQVRQLVKGLTPENVRRLQRNCSSFDRFVRHINHCCSSR